LTSCRPRKKNIQGHQIGQLFTNWATFYQLDNYLPIGQLFTNWATFYQLGNFFRNWATSYQLDNFLLIVQLFINWATFYQLGNFLPIRQLFPFGLILAVKCDFFKRGSNSEKCRHFGCFLSQ
jgi:hypothetical protein